MVYQGSKAGCAKWLVPLLQKIIDDKGIESYWEPFVGGANVIDKIKCENRLGSDNSPTLIALLMKAQEDINELPQEATREKFNAARAIYRGKSDEKMSPSEIGAYQFLASYGARGFPGGYAPNKGEHNYYQERLKNLKKQNLQGIDFAVGDYRDFDILRNTLIYCDPPYFGTKSYGYAYESKFNYEEYWDWVRETSKYNYVVCSEETFPDDFTIIRSMDKVRGVEKKNAKIANEKVGVWKDGLLGNYNFYD